MPSKKRKKSMCDLAIGDNVITAQEYKSQALTLDGSHLTIEDFYSVAFEKRKIEIKEEVTQRIRESRQLIYELASKDVPIYGFNRGVGWNKDKVIGPASFEHYNRNLLLSHSAGVKPMAEEAEIRAVMLARLNSLLLGCTGVQPEIVERYVDFLNLGIHPVLPLKGSVGAADISTISHIGLAMIGEGEVEVNGVRLPAAKAIQNEGLTPLKLGPKDGLAIVSSNALSAGTGAIALLDFKRVIELADMVYALSLEAIRGNISPLDEAVHRVRPFPGQLGSLKNIRKILAGSDLWTSYNKESLQDPLSFRDACQIHGAARDAYHYCKEQLELHINSSDDNPCVLVEEKRIVSCANFDPLSWVLGFEMAGNALHHISKSSCYRTIKLGNPSFTGLSRFLTPNEQESIGFCTLQKTITALDAEIRHLSNPASADYFSLAGDIEDHGTNAPFVVSKTRDILDKLFTILGIEAIHAAQAIDLRGSIQLGKGTKAAYQAIRSVVSFYSEDRNLTVDIEKIYTLFKNGKFLEKLKRNNGSEANGTS